MLKPVNADGECVEFAPRDRGIERILQAVQLPFEGVESAHVFYVILFESKEAVFNFRETNINFIESFVDLVESIIDLIESFIKFLSYLAEAARDHLREVIERHLPSPFFLFLLARHMSCILAHRYFATAMASSNFTDKSLETPSEPIVTP